MRNRFFIILLTSLILAAIGINLVHIYFFKNQRLKLIDKQITESSAVLLNSEKFIYAAEHGIKVEDTITEVLQGARIGKVFVVKDLNDRIVYQSFSVGLLKTDLPTSPEWVTVETAEEFVRIKNVRLPGQVHLMLQVGLVLNQNFLNWEIVDTRVVLYVSFIVLTLFLLAAFLTLILLSPLRLLIAHLSEATSNLTNMKDVRELPTELLKYSDGYGAKADEFSSLLSTAQKLIDRINMNYKLTRFWTSQMAHELKTPLAIIKLETEARKKENPSDQYSKDILAEVQQMTEIISQFLDWAELESSQGQKDLHALRIRNVIKNVTARLEKIAPQRLELQFNSDFSVFANPVHLDQLISNLVTNALKFSASTTKVKVILDDHALTIQDYGTGLPKEVIERLGQPFNVGSGANKNATGNGLGLAWVSTVSKLYQWKFSIQSSVEGTKATIYFPTEEEISG